MEGTRIVRTSVINHVALAKGSFKLESFKNLDDLLPTPKELQSLPVLSLSDRADAIFLLSDGFSPSDIQKKINDNDGSVSVNHISCFKKFGAFDMADWRLKNWGVTEPKTEEFLLVDDKSAVFITQYEAPLRLYHNLHLDSGVELVASWAYPDKARAESGFINLPSNKMTKDAGRSYWSMMWNKLGHDLLNG